MKKIIKASNRKMLIFNCDICNARWETDEYTFFPTGDEVGLWVDRCECGRGAKSPISDT